MLRPAAFVILKPLRGTQRHGRSKSIWAPGSAAQKVREGGASFVPHHRNV